MRAIYKNGFLPCESVAMGALFYSPVDFTDASDLSTLMQVWCIGEINRWIKQRTLFDEEKVWEYDLTAPSSASNR